MCCSVINNINIVKIKLYILFSTGSMKHSKSIVLQDHLIWPWFAMHLMMKLLQTKTLHKILQFNKLCKSIAHTTKILIIVSLFLHATTCLWKIPYFDDSSTYKNTGGKILYWLHSIKAFVLYMLLNNYYYIKNYILKISFL